MKRSKSNEIAYKRRRQYEEGKVMCLIEGCGGYYNKIGQHVYNSHNMTATDYKKMFNLPAKKGIISDRTRSKLQVATQQNYNKVVVNNLIEKGSLTRFVSLRNKHITK